MRFMLHYNNLTIMYYIYYTLENNNTVNIHTYILEWYNDNVTMCKHKPHCHDQNGIKQSKIIILKSQIKISKLGITLGLSSHFYIILSISALRI